MLCVIAKLDDASTEKLDKLRRAALPASAAWKPLYGHITLAAYVGGGEADFLRSCREMLEGLASFAVEYDRLAVLEETAILVALPRKSGLLETLHRRIAARWEDSLDAWTGTARWVPHTTLLCSRSLDLHRLCADMEKRFAPFLAKVTRIEFSRVLEDGYEIAERIELAP